MSDPQLVYGSKNFFSFSNYRLCNLIKQSSSKCVLFSCSLSIADIINIMLLLKICYIALKIIVCLLTYLLGLLSVKGIFNGFPAWETFTSHLMLDGAYKRFLVSHVFDLREDNNKMWCVWPRFLVINDDLYWWLRCL